MLKAFWMDNWTISTKHRDTTWVHTINITVQKAHHLCYEDHYERICCLLFSHAVNEILQCGQKIALHLTFHSRDTKHHWYCNKDTVSTELPTSYHFCTLHEGTKSTYFQCAPLTGSRLGGDWMDSPVDGAKNGRLRGGVAVGRTPPSAVLWGSEAALSPPGWVADKGSCCYHLRSEASPGAGIEYALPLGEPDASSPGAAAWPAVLPTFAPMSAPGLGLVQRSVPAHYKAQTRRSRGTAARCDGEAGQRGGSAAWPLLPLLQERKLSFTRPHSTVIITTPVSYMNGPSSISPVLKQLLYQTTQLKIFNEQNHQKSTKFSQAMSCVSTSMTSA